MSKLAIITGADGGMGTEITRAVAQAGYHVIMLCYTLFKGEERKNQLILETGNKEIEVRQVDLSSMASVIRFRKKPKSSPKLTSVVVSHFKSGFPM